MVELKKENTAYISHIFFSLDFCKTQHMLDLWSIKTHFKEILSYTERHKKGLNKWSHICSWIGM